MPRDIIDPQLSSGPSPLDLTALTWTTLVDANGTKVPLTGRELLFFRGLGTVTLVSTPDGSGRTSDIVRVLTGADPVFAGPIGMLGWRQSDQPFLHINSTTTAMQTIQIAVLTIF